MNIIFYHPFFDSELWINGMKKHLPQANIRKWVPVITSRRIMPWCGYRRVNVWPDGPP